MAKNKTYFADCLKKYCSPIVDEVLCEMQKNRHKVGDIKPSIVPKNPILYRWWFPENSPAMKELRKFAIKNTEFANLLRQVETFTEGNTTYYALYFGKSVKGYRRFVQHATGNVHISTIRHTLYGLCYEQTYDKNKEKNITEMLKECYYEWYSFDNEGKLIECIESICIALGKYPLNIDGNPAICAAWQEYILKKRALKRCK